MSIESEAVEDENLFTCDIMGSDPLCAMHCIGLGYRGGWCDKRLVCNCRR